MNLRKSWVPRGSRRSTYSAPTIASAKDFGVRLMVARNSMLPGSPPGFIRVQRERRNSGTSATCSTTSQAAIDQAFAATQWVGEHGKEISVDSSRLAVAGNSVGGNMAAVVALKAKEAGKPKLSFQLLLWPVTDANFDNVSYDHFAEGHFLTRNMMKWFWDNYTTDPKQRAERFASPLRATAEQLKGLPPTLIQTAEFDVLRDEGEAYARKLDAAGVTVTAVRYNGMIHDYGLLNPLAHVPAVQAAMRQAGNELKQHLR